MRCLVLQDQPDPGIVVSHFEGRRRDDQVGIVVHSGILGGRPPDPQFARAGLGVEGPPDPLDEIP